MNKHILLDNFSLEKTIESGQCFRFTKNINNSYDLIAKDKKINILQKNNELFYDCSEYDFKNYWINYFDLNNNYDKIEEEIIKEYPELKEIVKNSSGIHFLKQDYFETYISFIISQNNNIPRIKKNIEALCETYGVKENTFFSFPDIKTLKKISIEDFNRLKVGFRDKYLYDACQNYNEKIPYLKEDTNNIRNELIKIHGIGRKVADCILLFGLNKKDVFPIDTHIKKIMENMYFNKSETNINIIQKFAQEYFKDYQSYIQQYLFYNSLNNK